jgi:hypothetical protein
VATRRLDKRTTRLVAWLISGLVVSALFWWLGSSNHSSSNSLDPGVAVVLLTKGETYANVITAMGPPCYTGALSGTFLQSELQGASYSLWGGPQHYEVAVFNANQPNPLEGSIKPAGTLIGAFESAPGAKLPANLCTTGLTTSPYFSPAWTGLV